MKACLCAGASAASFICDCVGSSDEIVQGMAVAFVPAVTSTAIECQPLGDTIVQGDQFAATQARAEEFAVHYVDFLSDALHCEKCGLLLPSLLEKLMNDLSLQFCSFPFILRMRLEAPQHLKCAVLRCESEWV